jgi:acetyltransferase-like isoleucine patch superfamily enzyme
MQMLNNFLKRFVFVAFRVAISFIYRAYSIEGVNALLLLLPAKLIVPTLRRFGATVGNEAQIHSPLIIHNASSESGRHYAHLIIGDHCYIGRDVLLDLRERLIFEEYVTISMRCTLLTHTDVGARPAAYSIPYLPASSAPIYVRSGAYLGANSTVLQGVTIGRRAVVGACALVRDDVEDEAKVAGVPAQRIA